MSHTVRIEAKAHRMLRELAEQKRASMQEIISQALKVYSEQVFLDGLAEDFAALRADPEAWAEEQAEREAWDVTLADEAAVNSGSK